MDILDGYERLLADYIASLRGLETDLGSAAAKTVDADSRGALEHLLRSIQGKQGWIATDGRLEMAGAQARIDAGLRAFEELRARKEALAERMEQLRAILESPPA